MGFPEFSTDRTRVDAFKFADTKLSAKVSKGFHAIAVDEERHDFIPTLWDTADNVTQLLFPGAHSDVGGGYPMINGESGLSDCALQWMMDRLSENGVRFAATLPIPVKPDPTGIAHKPWRHIPFNVPTVFVGRRTFPAGMTIDASIEKRRAAAGIIGEPGETPVRYQPSNLP